MPEKLQYRIVEKYPHDADAFVQGLVYWQDGFFESTGTYMQLSELRRVELASGRVTNSIYLGSQHFGEGLAMVGDRLIQLTWKSQMGFVYARETFACLRTFAYDGEGWGLTFDGNRLIMSDGTDRLRMLDPESQRVVGDLRVISNGVPLYRLNELQYIDGLIWANVWPTDFIVMINPLDGQITSYLDFSDLFPAHLRQDESAVLNGIAHDPQSGRIFVTGKLFPHLFEISVPM